MRFVKTPKPTTSLAITNGHYINRYGRTTHHSRQSRTHAPVSFVGVDGEGMTIDGDHRYVLFGIGEDQIEDTSGLQWNDVFDFMYDHYRPGTAYTGFYLGYDFTQIIRTLPEDRAWMLLTAEGRALRKHRIPGKQPHPVEYQGWQFDMMAAKRLRIRPKLCDCPHATCKCMPKAPWMFICDVGGYFQSSFLTVIDPKGWSEGTAVVTPDEFALIKEGKERRSQATLDDDMRMYNRLENAVLSRVMSTVDTGLKQIGVELSPSKWFGPGQAAQAWLKREGVPRRIDLDPVVPIWFFEAARMSYFGGWFEQMIHGIIPGTSYEYDVNSAYPSIIAGLPCLIHGKYTRGNGLPETKPGDLCLVYGNVWSPGMPHNGQRQHIGAMLHRDRDGQILRPMSTEGWYWWDELRSASKAGLVKRLDNRGKQQIDRWVNYEPCDCLPPMKGVHDLYLKRLEVGKKTPLGRAAKLIYNSDYGKFAQSVGEPVFGNPIYASRITSECRRMILDAIATHPIGKAAVAMVATDGVYFLSPHETLPISEKLGEWDFAERQNLTLFKPGVYWDDSTRERIAEGKSPHFKARGFKAADFAANIARVDDEYLQWTDALPGRDFHGVIRGWPTVDFTPAFAMTTALQALRQNDWTRAGAVSEGMKLVQTADPYRKREGLYRDVYDGRTIYRSRPHWGMSEPHAGELEWIASHPYTKRFGLDDPWSDDYKGQTGITEDGNIVDILAWILNGE